MQGVNRDIIEGIDSVESFFPLPKGVSSSISGDLELAAAISELSHNDVILTDTTIHAFMVCLLINYYLLNYVYWDYVKSDLLLIRYLYAINSPISEVYKISSKGIILHSSLLLLRAYKYIMTYLVSLVGFLCR